MPRNIKPKHLFFPLIYFYFLSMALILVSGFWLISSPGEINKSYAQVEFNSLFDINVKVKKAQPLIFNYDPNSDCNIEYASKIDLYFAERGAPLAGQGCNFVKHAEENEIDPYLVAAIGQCESSGGKTTPQYGGVESYNAWGWAVFDNNDVTKGINGYGCGSWENCIGRVSRGIKRNSDSRNLTTAPSDVVQWYNPGSVRRAGGNPANATWTQCVSSMMSKIEKTGADSIAAGQSL